ncbi:glycosyltransferase [Paenibacillus koleovorans]|uniref:glycosyltransferase n=1 Tax=Paenibacillus koleovorans TaxID=121608 RepID=UPI000FD81C94|nr:glycosyltransferase [Paenibacillus koleovorans]
MKKKRVLIGSPVRQTPAILERFLDSLRRLEKKSLAVSYLFVDDNEDPAASSLLQKFRETAGRAVVVSQQQHRVEQEQLRVGGVPASSAYVKDETTHYWKEDLIWKVASMKDGIIREALAKKFDYLFLIDSDLLLQPETLEQLVRAERDIVSNVFWTRWKPDAAELPQVWLRDEYTLFDKRREEALTPMESSIRTLAFLERLRTPGVYEVGGLGACTLISRKALRAGVRFEEIPNLSFSGEDRHFCIRAAALGIPLHVDTHYPAFHLYRESDLAGVDAYLAGGYANTRDKLAYGLELQRQALFEQAVQQLDAYLDEEAGSPSSMIEAAFSLSECYERLGDKDNQLLAMLRSLEFDVPQPETCCRIGAMYVERKEWSQAVYWYRTATEAEETAGESQERRVSRTWLPHLQMCLCYDRLGMLKDAYRHNTIAFSFKPDHPSVLYNQAYFAQVLADRKFETSV